MFYDNFFSFDLVKKKYLEVLIFYHLKIILRQPKLYKRRHELVPRNTEIQPDNQLGKKYFYLKAGFKTIVFLPNK